jgi:hypothetical protein
VRYSTPSSSPNFTSASGTARVPPRGYQTPSVVCMWAMPQSTAGDDSGHDPTYCVKWSSICAPRASGTYFRTVPATERPIRIARMSPMSCAEKPARRSIMSRTEPMDFQK